MSDDFIENQTIRLSKFFFFTESKERHKNLKRTEITPYMKGAVTLQRLVLYARVRLFLSALLFKIVKNLAKRKELGVEEVTAPFIYGVISVRLKF